MKDRIMLDRLFPTRADNVFEGHRAALWLFGVLIALRLVVSVNSIANTALVAAGADGIPLDRFGPEAAREVLTLFALIAVGQLASALVGLAVLIRYRALLPLLYLVSLAEQLARRLAVGMHEAATYGSRVAAYVTWTVFGLLIVGLVLSFLPARPRNEI
jgi:hypothetical protein